MIRRSWVIWALPVLLGLIVVYAGDTTPEDDGYWTAATAVGTLFISFTAPACAACAAWEGFRSRRLLEAVGNPVRSSVRVMAGSCWPVGGLAVSALGLVLWLYAPVPGTPGGPDISIVGTELLILIAHIAAGYVVGRAFPVVIAIPLAAIGSFLVTTAGLGIEPTWIRHIGTTNLYNCCTLDEVPAAKVLVASCLFAGGVIASALLVVSVRRTLPRAASVLPVLAGTVAAVYLVMPLGWLPTAPRAISAAECTDGVPRVCIWPEQSGDAIRASATDVLTRMDEIGVQYADTLDPITFAHSSPGHGEIVATMVSGLLPTQPEECPLEYPEWYFNVQERTSSWLFLTAGLDDGSVEGTAAPENLEFARSVRSELSPAEQLRWYEASAAALEGCPQAEMPTDLDDVVARGDAS